MNALPTIKFTKRKILWRWYGYALPPYAIFVWAKAPDIVYIIKHEWGHFLQAQDLWWVGFIPVYVYEWFRAGIVNKDIKVMYSKHRMEMEARYLGRADIKEIDERKPFSWTKY